MKKLYLILIIIVILVIVGLLAVRFLLGGNEDVWIKNNLGVYAKHGNPAETPNYVIEQQEAIMQALELYSQKKSEGMQFSSQCLGVVGENVKYAVDVVHVPRVEEDNIVENQCEDYQLREVSNFIELDKDGKIVRVV